jgi:hypothetical protein
MQAGGPDKTKPNQTKMKKIILAAVFILSLSPLLSAQSCLPGGINFSFQWDIDSFSEDYPDCTEIEGDVEIDLLQISSLEGLSQLTRIGGNLNIDGLFYNANLTSLQGLENLTSIGKDFTIISVEGLTDISALGNITKIGGSCSINSVDLLQSLSGLENLDSIGGDLSIKSNSLLVNLDEFANLSHVGGDIIIDYNTSLTSLSGLESMDASSISNLTITRNNHLFSCESAAICNYLANPGGSIIIYGNATGCQNAQEVAAGCGVNLTCLPHGTYYFTRQEDIDNYQAIYPDCTDLGGDVIFDDGYPEITNLNGLSQVTSIGGNCEIHELSSLTSLAGLENLENIGGDFTVYHNALLGNLSNLYNLDSIGGFFYLFANDALVDFTGLGNLKSIGGYFNVSYNHALNNFAGIENLESVGGSLKIYLNNALTSLAGLESLQPGSVFDIQVIRNHQLSSCEAGGICNYLANPSGKVDIYDNAPGCNNPAEIANLCGITLPCLPYGDYTFSTQADIDNFQTNYPDCSLINGNLTITGTGIENLDGLNNLEGIEGNLTIKTDTFLITRLKTISGLNHLAYITGNLTIWGQDSLPNLTGLENLVTIGGDLDFYTNTGLHDLSGIENLSHIGGDLGIVNGYSLNSITALDNLSSIGGSLDVSGNVLLTTLAGLDHISAGTINKLVITSNPSLSYCHIQSICDYLVSPNGSVSIYENGLGCQYESQIMDSCEIVSCLPQGISFSTQSEIDNFQTNYPDCDIVDGTIRINGSDIHDLSGLSSIVSIDGDLEITGNGQIVNLEGLDNLEKIGGSIRIINNPALTDIDGLKNVNPETIDGIDISGNAALSHCEIKSLCDYIAGHTGLAIISANAAGCNSEEEVHVACTAGVPVFGTEPRFTIIPNPSSKAISISCKDDLSIDHVNIYDQMGQIMLHSDRQSYNIDVSAIIPGLYVVEIVTGNLRTREKLIIF